MARSCSSSWATPAFRMNLGAMCPRAKRRAAGAFAVLAAASVIAIQAAQAQPSCEMLRPLAYNSLDDALGRFSRQMPITRLETPTMKAAAAKIVGQMGMSPSASLTPAMLSEVQLKQWSNNHSVKSPAERFLLANLEYVIAAKADIQQGQTTLSLAFEQANIEALKALNDLYSEQTRFLELSTNKRFNEIVADLQRLENAVQPPQSSSGDLHGIMTIVYGVLSKVPGAGFLALVPTVVYGAIDAATPKERLVRSQTNASGPGAAIIRSATLTGVLDEAKAQVDAQFGSVLADFGRLEAMAALENCIGCSRGGGRRQSARAEAVALERSSPALLHSGCLSFVERSARRQLHIR